MGHHHAADKPRRDPPARRPCVLLRAAFREELYAACLCEILSEKVRRPRLQGLPVLHHRLYAIGVHRPGEFFSLSLFAADYGHRHVVLRELLVDAQHFLRLLFGLCARSVGGVALLPKKFSRAQKEARAHLPPHDIRPLVDENRQVAVRLHPARVHFADDCLGSRADDQRFVERRGGRELSVGAELQAGVGDHRALLCKPLNVLRFLFEIAHGNEEREIGVHVTRRLEHLVERRLHVLPKGISPRLYDHAAADGAVFRQVGGFDYLLVPLGIVLFPRGLDCGSFFLCHIEKRQAGSLSESPPGFKREIRTVWDSRPRPAAGGRGISGCVCGAEPFRGVLRRRRLSRAGFCRRFSARASLSTAKSGSAE